MSRDSATIVQGFQRLAGVAGALLLAALAWLLVLILAAFLWLAVVRPWQQAVHGLQERIALKAERLARLRGMIEHAASGGNARRERLARQLAVHLLPAGDAALVMADLQARIQQLVKAHGGTVMQVRPLKPRQEGGFRRLGLALHFRAPLPGAYRILHELETGRPMLFIDKATLRLFSATGNRLLSSGEIATPLALQLEAYGFQQMAEHGR